MAEPLPAMGQAQVKPEAIQGNVRGTQRRQAFLITPMLGRIQRFRRIQRGIHEPGCQGISMDPWKTLRLGQQPVQQVEHA